MMPRKEEVVPTSVQLAYQIVTRLSDFSAMTESDDLYSNIKALAHTFVSVGKSLICIAFAVAVLPCHLCDIVVVISPEVFSDLRIVV